MIKYLKLNLKIMNGPPDGGATSEQSTKPSKNVFEVLKSKRWR